MNTAHFDALLWLETRRVGPLVLRLIGATIVVLGLFAAFGRATAENVVAIALGSGFGAVLIVPMTVSRDKLERTMDFLRSLPTTASEIAAARFAAAALSALPNAVLAGAALLVVDLPAPFDFVSGRFAVAATVALWILLTTAAWLLIAASAAFELSSLLSWPLIALVLFALVLPRVGAWILPDDPIAAITRFLAHPWAPAAIAGILAALTAGIGAAAFIVTRRAIARYTPTPDRPL